MSDDLDARTVIGAILGISFLSLVLAIIRDIGNPYSHETLAALLTIVAILSYLRHRFRGGGVAWIGVNQLKELQMNLLV